MPTSYVRVYVHFVWATWDREPMIAPEWESRLHAAIAAKCQEIDCELIAVNGMADHLHVLLRISATVSVADTARHLKGATSHLVNAAFHPRSLFRWQGAYSAFSVEIEGVDRVRSYIINQKRHHAQSTLLPDWECAAK